MTDKQLEEKETIKRLEEELELRKMVIKEMVKSSEREARVRWIALLFLSLLYGIICAIVLYL